MAYGICYTQSGTVKRYEDGGFDRPDRVKWVTGYTVGYPSTAYYPGLLCDNFYAFSYNSHPDFYTQYPGFTEGTGIYFINASIWDIPAKNEEANNSYMGYKKIYNLMSDIAPDGFVLCNDGDHADYTVTKMATVYSYNDDVKYFNAINSINIGTATVKREFRYKKKYKPDTYIDYYVIFTLNGTTLHCKCDGLTDIPGTNGGDFTLGINIELGDGVGYGVGGGHSESFIFEWKIKDGIDESKYCSYSLPYYLGSGFTTQNGWEQDNGDGTKVYFTFHIDRSSIPDPPHG